LAEQDRHYQGAGRGADGKSTDPQAAKDRTKRNRQKQENSGACVTVWFNHSMQSPREKWRSWPLFFRQG
jgi:hypothetical protein